MNPVLGYELNGQFFFRNSLVVSLNEVGGGDLFFKEVQPLQAMVNCQAKQTEAKDEAEDEHQEHTEGETEQAKWRQGR